MLSNIITLLQTNSYTTLVQLDKNSELEQEVEEILNSYVRNSTREYLVKQLEQSLSYNQQELEEYLKGTLKALKAYYALVVALKRKRAKANVTS